MGLGSRRETLKETMREIFSLSGIISGQNGLTPAPKLLSLMRVSVTQSVRPIASTASKQRRNNFHLTPLVDFSHGKHAETMKLDSKKSHLWTRCSPFLYSFSRLCCVNQVILIHKAEHTRPALFSGKIGQKIFPPIQRAMSNPRLDYNEERNLILKKRKPRD